MATPNLAISHIASSQNQKEVTANTAFDDLDLAMTDAYSFALTTGDYTFSNPEALTHMVYQMTGTPGAPRNIIVPVNKKLYIFKNATTSGHAHTVKTFAGTGVTLAPGGYAVLYCDGTNVIVLSAPRLTFNVHISDESVTAGVRGRFILSQAIVVTRISIVCAVAGAGNSTAGIVRVTDGTTPTDTTLTDATSIFDSGIISVPMAAGVNLDVDLNTASSGGTPATGIMVSVEYKMQ